MCDCKFGEHGIERCAEHQRRYDNSKMTEREGSATVRIEQWEVRLKKDSTD